MAETYNLKSATDEALVKELEARAEGLPAALKTRLLAVLAKDIRPQVEGALAAADETVPEATGITRFKAQYESLNSKYKDKCKYRTWEEAEKILTENGGHFLKLAEAMNGGGVLFGVDKDGRLLFADKGPEPIMTGMNYPDTRKAVMFTEKEGEQMPTGYEMFPYSSGYSKSDEILAYEASVNDTVVRSENRKEWRGIWLESGENSDWPRFVRFVPDDGDAYVFNGNPQSSGQYLGVRRLLRV